MPELINTIIERCPKTWNIGDMTECLQWSFLNSNVCAPPAKKQPKRTYNLKFIVPAWWLHDPRGRREVMLNTELSQPMFPFHRCNHLRIRQAFTISCPAETAFPHVLLPTGSCQGNIRCQMNSTNSATTLPLRLSRREKEKIVIKPPSTSGH